MLMQINEMNITKLFYISLFFIVSCSPPFYKQIENKNEFHNNQIDTRPNIILIIADDVSWDDIGAYGHPSIKTPNLDRLAREGMRFDNAFLTTSSCSPSRSSIITGKYPHMTDAEQLHWPLPEQNVTFVEKLREAGYWTAQAGKWHLGEAVKDRFDLIIAEGANGFVYKTGGQESGFKKDTEMSDGSGAQNWIPALNARPKDKPFFLWLAAVDPHRPYFENAITNPHRLSDVRLPPYFPDNEEVRKDFVMYYDEVSRMDAYIGRLDSALKEQRISENTLILFITDNGRPFPRDKTTLYDGGIKTPWIVKWPAKVRAGGVSLSMVSSLDIATTFLSLANVPISSNFLGEDFSSILSDPKTEIRDFIFAQDHWHDFADYSRAVRNKRFKYIKNYYPDLPNTPSADALRAGAFQSMIKLEAEGKLTEAQRRCFVSPRDQEELYDMIEDPYELNNLAKHSAYQNQLLIMRTELEKIRKATNDILPMNRTPDEFDRTSGKPNQYRIRPRPSKEEMKRTGRAG